MDKNDLLNQKINWKPFGDYKGFRYALLNVDMKKKLIDLLFQFDANQQCFYHRHYHPTFTLVLYGEHHVFENNKNGGLDRQVKKAGEFAMSTGEETHIEGGGEMGCTIYQNVRANSDLVYSVLNDDLSLKLDVSIEHFYQDFLKDAA